MQIRELEYEDLKKASDVLWKSFYQAEKNHTSMKGMEYFRDATSPVSLSISTYENNVRLFGVFEEDLVAVGGIKGENHILLLYVLPEKAGEGIGTALLSYLEELCGGGELTVNASVPAFSFYEKRGFVKTGAEKEEEGQIFVPMAKKVEKE